MNHEFIEIKKNTIPQDVLNLIEFYNLDYRPNSKYIIRQCTICYFILINVIGNSSYLFDEFYTFDIFYFKNKEVYEEFDSYTTLSNEINLTCNDFVIKDLLE